MLLLYWAESVVNLCYSEELSARVEVLESTNQELERELDDLRESADKEAETKYTMIGELQDRLSTLKSELLSLEGDKANILSEVRVAVRYTRKLITHNIFGIRWVYIIMTDLSLAGVIMTKLQSSPFDGGEDNW